MITLESHLIVERTIYHLFSERNEWMFLLLFTGSTLSSSTEDGPSQGGDASGKLSRCPHPRAVPGLL